MSIKPPFLNLSKNEQKMALEVLLFSAEEPLSTKKMFDLLIANNFENATPSEDDNNENKNQISINQEIMNKFNITPDYFSELISEINIELIETNRPYQIINIAEGYQFASRSEYGELVSNLTKMNLKRKFSKATLEVLAIIAYKQPITKPEIEQIRGVNSNEIVNTLLSKNLVKIVGRKDVLGKPLLFTTTKFFLKTFGLKNLQELPKLREIEDLSLDDINTQSHIEVTLNANEDIDVNSLQDEIDKDYELNENYEKKQDNFKITKEDFDKMKN